MKSDLFNATVIIVCVITVILMLLLALTGCSTVPQPAATTQPQEPLTAEQEVLKARYLENLREIFYGDDASMYLAIERAQTKRSK